MTGGAGARAMMMAFEEVFGVRHTTSDVPFAGRTDTWIISELARRHSVEHTPERLKRFHDLYLERLAVEVHKPGPQKGILPGVRALLDNLYAHDSIHLALLTGNFEGGARLKLTYFDLWRYFVCGAFAEDAPDRNSLFQTAVGKVKAIGGPDVTPSEVVIVGDTPLDVGVAVAAGARSLAVATGSFDADALRAAGADVVLEDLSDLETVRSALGLDE
jgi:phosphoglycolate phosphatase-like HAD superfamily hydrolase